MAPSEGDGETAVALCRPVIPTACNRFLHVFLRAADGRERKCNGPTMFTPGRYHCHATLARLVPSERGSPAERQ